MIAILPSGDVVVGTLVILKGVVLRKISVASAIVFALVIQSPIPVGACGDKLLMLGRGIRFHSRHSPRPAAVLLYLPAAARGGGPLSDPKLESALTEAGHTVRSVSTQEELSDALRTGQYDVLLTDLAEAPDLQRTPMVVGNNPIVLPAVYLLASTSQQQVKTDTARAAKEFSLVVQVPGRPGHYCAAVDKAMELKLKRDRSTTPRP